MNTMPSKFPFPHNVSGIIIAGGTSSRYQKENEPWQDKALQTVSENMNLLQRTVKIFSEICDEIIIVVNNSIQSSLYLSTIIKLDDGIKSKVKIIKDNPSYLCSGPTLGLLTGIQEAKNNFVLMAPVDMPLLSAVILQELIINLMDSSMIVPYWPSTGKIEPLIAAFNVQKTLENGLLLSIIKRSRADDIHRLVPKIKFLPISTKFIKISEEIFTNLNEPELLANLKAINLAYSDVDFFIPSQSFIIENKFQKNELNELFAFLKEKMFMHFSQKDLDKITKITNLLFKKESYFIVGLVHYNLIDLIPEDNENKKEIQSLCIQAFTKEAEKWNRNKVGFLELHSYTDALSVQDSSFKQQSKEELHSKISSLKEKMNLKKKNHKKYDMDELINKRSPNLLEKIKQIIQKSESDFNKENSLYETNFLWDHSYRVGKIAYTLALREGVNPLIPTIAALFHDAGKFVLGKYHVDNVSEEEHSASIAEGILKEEDFSSKEIHLILSAISALYSDQMECDLHCQIVHDADRLEKSGLLGIANFFTKATLRGKNLSDALSSSLSRELTYANASPKTMLTKSGRLFAIEKSKKTIDYFDGLLEELALFGIGRFYSKKTLLEKGVEIILVVPENCSHCKGEYMITISTEKGIKCEKLTAHFSCNRCSEQYNVSFCLPILS